MEIKHCQFHSVFFCFVYNRFLALNNRHLKLSDSWHCWVITFLETFKAQVAQSRNMSIGEHRHCCLTFKIYVGFVWEKKPIVSLTYENERISIIRCVLRLSCVVHGQIYGSFMGFYVNGFLGKTVSSR